VSEQDSSHSGTTMATAVPRWIKSRLGSPPDTSADFCGLASGWFAINLPSLDTVGRARGAKMRQPAPVLDAAQEQGGSIRQQSCARLVQRNCGRVSQSDQSSQRIVLWGERSRGLRVDDGEHLAAAHSADDQTVTLDGDNSVPFVEDGHAVSGKALRGAQAGFQSHSRRRRLTPRPRCVSPG
jgi:hypothetical protein